MTTDISVGVRWDPLNGQNGGADNGQPGANGSEDYEFDYDGGNSSSRLFERSRIRALAGQSSFFYLEIVSLGWMQLCIRFLFLLHCCKGERRREGKSCNQMCQNKFCANFIMMTVRSQHVNLFIFDLVHLLQNIFLPTNPIQNPSFYFNCLTLDQTFLPFQNLELLFSYFQHI